MNAASKPSLVVLLNSLAIGGAERHTLSLVRGLKHQFAITLVSLKALAASQPALQVDADIPTVCLDVRRRFDAGAAQALADLLRATGAASLVCVNTYPLLYAHWARRRLQSRLRIVSVFHTTMLWTWRGRAEMAFYWPLFRRSDDLVFLCDAQQRYWEARGVRARRNCKVYNGVDTDHFDPASFEAAGAALRARLGWSPQDRVVGLCALLRVEKAHGLLMQAVGELARQGQPWKVLLIGDGPLRAAIERQVAALGLGAQVHITGLLSDVRPAIAACDVMSLVSVSETFSMAVLEAMAMGKPMVMSDVGGAREQVRDGENGRLFPAGDTAALAQALRTFWDRGTAERMGQAARRRVLAEFSQATMVAAYQRLLSSEPPCSEEISGRPFPAGRTD
jgi:glycosyltransferase involved in cell wall biosynthesis